MNPKVNQNWKLVLSARLEGQLSEVEVSIHAHLAPNVLVVKHLVEDAATCAKSNGIYDIFEFTFDQTNLDGLKDRIYRIPLSLIVSYSKLPSPLPNPKETCLGDFDRLLQSGASSDFIFEVDGEEISAHKLILSTRSTYFQTLFNSGMREATENRAAIQDIDAASFKAILKFLYCGRLPEDLKTSAKNYLPVADKYDIQELKEACEYALERTITRDNVAELMVTADMFHCAELKAEAIEQFMTYGKSLTDEQLAPLKAHPELVLECHRKD